MCGVSQQTWDLSKVASKLFGKHHGHFDTWPAVSTSNVSPATDVMTHVMMKYRRVGLFLALRLQEVLQTCLSGCHMGRFFNST